MSEDKRQARLDERKAILAKLKQIADRPKDFAYGEDTPDHPHKPASSWHDKDGT